MSYPGGKEGEGVFHAIINQMPPHTVYIEPFLGGGAIMRIKRPAAVNIGLDLDRIAVQQFVAGFRPGSPVMAVSDRGWVRTFGKGWPWRASGPAERWEFACGDAIQFLRRYPFSGGELVYCDPPYLMATRLTKGRLYRCEMTDADHRRLLAVLVRLPCYVMVSGYASLLGSWRSFSFQATNRAGKKTTEVVWSNFPEPVALHDYRQLGSDFREREKIRKKTRRWVRRLGSMDVLSRRALLAALQEMY